MRNTKHLPGILPIEDREEKEENAALRDPRTQPGRSQSAAQIPSGQVAIEAFMGAQQKAA